MMIIEQARENFLNWWKDIGQPIYQHTWDNKAISIPRITSEISNSHGKKQCKNG
jgi:hypothetical protein